MTIIDLETNDHQNAAIEESPWSAGAAKPATDGFRPFAACGWFALRIPVLPFDLWSDWNNASVISAELNINAAGGAVPRSRQELRQILKANFTPQVIEGLYLASPSLINSMPEWFRNPDSRKSQRIESSLVAYFSRLAGRPTPFGFFSSLQAGGIGSVTNLDVQDDHYQRKTRIHTRYFRDWFRLAGSPQGASGVKYVPNPTVHVVGGQAHYLKRISKGTDKSAFSVASCKAGPILDAILKIAEPGASLHEIALHLSARPEFSENLRADLLSFLERLAQAQILLPECGTVIIGDHETQDLLELSSTIQEIRSRFEEMDAKGPGIELASYAAIENRLRQDFGKIRYQGPQLFFADLTRCDPQLSLGRNVVDEFLKAFDLLRSISREDDLTWRRFAQKFEERFGSSEVPLLEVFDADFDFDFDVAARGTSDFQARDEYLLRKVFENARSGSIAIQLSENDLSHLRRSHTGEPPGCFALLGILLASSTEKINSGNYKILLEGITRAAGLMARFSSINDEWRERIAELIEHEREASAGAILADVVYEPPEEPISNVICRPPLTDYVIPFFGVTSVPSDRRIPLTDLTVSIRTGRVVLRSVRHDKEILPVHNSPYAFHHAGSPPVLRFLCKLAMGTSNVAWNWGPVLESLPFLPRLEYGRLVIARARWLISDKELHGIELCNDADLLNHINALCRAHLLPQRISFVQEGKKIAVDLTNVLSVRMFLRLAHNQSVITVTELLPDINDLCVANPKGRFQHEIVLPVRKMTAPAQKITDSVQSSITSCGRSSSRYLPPGSEWLYVKIYVRPWLTDTVLAGALSTVTDELIRKKTLREWFYIRYSDPYHHLRIRLHLDHPQSSGATLNSLAEHLNPLLNSSLIWKWQIDTYEREVERYGGLHTMETAEQIFCADSAFAAQTLRSFSMTKEREEARLPLCLVSIDTFLGDFDLALADRRRILAAMQKKLRGRIKDCKAWELEVAADFRTAGRNVLQMAAGLLSAQVDALQQRSAFIRRTRASVANGGLETMIADFIHMSVNRLMRSRSAEEEFRIYEFLNRFYVSCMARGFIHVFGPNAHGA